MQNQKMIILFFQRGRGYFEGHGGKLSAVRYLENPGAMGEATSGYVNTRSEWPGTGHL